MPDLRQESLHLDRLPLQYLSLIRHLDRFITDSLELKPRKDVAEPTEIAALRRQHDELMAEALQFFGATLDDADLLDSRWALALGLYRCSYYESTVLGDVPLVDTCGSLTIGDFRVDTAQGETLRTQIGSWLDVDQNALADAVEEELDSLHLRHAIVAALEERHAFLNAQLEDLKKTRRDLMDIVQEVDARVQEVFSSAYLDVEREFAAIFGRLFPGGEGRLLLTSPEDMLTTGVEVEARPPGKKVKRLSLLSGGERSLTAVAFLAAIFKARPSPFYVMDEVEAALDDTNLQRLLVIFEELRAASQLIVITHQKRTMEAADALYGVTMQGDGISQVISQKLERPA